MKHSEYNTNKNGFTFAPVKKKEKIPQKKCVKLITVIKVLVTVISCLVVYELIK